MSKVTKSSLTRRLDRACSDIVRSRGKCERCGSVDTLQCCHIFSRTYRNLRWDLDNLLCMCASCHFFCHKNPLSFSDFVERKLGKDKIDQLNETRNTIVKFTIKDLQLKLDVLNSLPRAESK